MSKACLIDKLLEIKMVENRYLNKIVSVFIGASAIDKIKPVLSWISTELSRIFFGAVFRVDPTATYTPTQSLFFIIVSSS